VDALAAALEFQQAMIEANRGQPDDQAIVFRIGLHLGDVIVEGDDIYGDAVNVAARLEAEAPPGGIIVSRAVREAVTGRLKVSLHALGELALKNIERPIRAFRAEWNAEDWPADSVASQAAASPQEPTPALTLPDKPSIAVLPFQNMSGDPEQEYFVEGLAEEIITALSRFKALFVIARNSSFTYKGKAVDIKQVGRELGVRYVLEGSVRKAANRLRISGQLIDASTGGHLWADHFDGVIEDIFELQDRMTSSVVGAIAPKLERAEIEWARRKPTEQLRSYDLYLRARALAHDRRFEDAYQLFKQVVSSDPEYAAAHVMVALMSQAMQGYGGVPLDPDRLSEAIKHLELAVKHDPDDAFVLAWGAHAFAYLAHDYDRAARLSEEAVALNPNLAAAWHSRGWIALMNANPDRAIQSFDRMLRLSPLDPLRTLAWCGTAFAHMFLNQYTAGCEQASKAIQVAANAHSLGAFIVNAMAGGRQSEARDAAQWLLRVQPKFRAVNARSTFPIRSDEWQQKIIQSLIDAGIPP
jgi:adenylate cyclase